MGWKTGDRVGGGKWELKERKGAGTYGEVWRAEEPLLGRQRALKKLHPHLERTPQLWMEARNLAALEHKNILRLWDWDAEGVFLVLDYIDGKSLEEVLRECQREGEWPDDSKCVQIVELCLEALEAAHEKGVAHGDVKPGNILVPIRSTIGADFEGLKLADFGVARNLDEEAPSGGPWQGVDWRGSRTYSAPEVLRGQSPSEVSDLFSLGMIAYLLLAKRHPFVDATGLLPIADLIKDKDFLPDYTLVTDDCLREVVRKLLDKEVDRRYLSAREALDALRDCLRSTRLPEAEELEPEAPEPVEEKAARRRARPAGAEAELNKSIQRALELQRSGQQDAALDVLQEALGTHRDAAETYSALFSRAYSQAAFLVNYQRRYNEAIELCDRAIQLHPTSYAFRSKGYALQNLGRLNEAVAMFDAALRYEADGRRRSQILAQKSRVLYLEGDFSKALETAKEALALDPSNEHAQRIQERLPAQV